MVADFKKHTKLVLDVHLMVQAPERYIDEFIEAGADIVTVHQEATTHLHRTILQIKNAGVKCGVSINPATNICTLEDVLGDIDMVLLMSCDPGFGGQPFIPYALNKARNLRQMMGDRQIDIEVDGGVSEKNIDVILDSGINVIVAGSALFSSPDPKKTLEILRRGNKK
jgi:ribulose-phosphate 3-epimerase